MHDSNNKTYRLLFGNKIMMQQLLRDLIHEPWVADLDLDSLERINYDFEGESFGLTDEEIKGRQGDVLWKATFRDGRVVFLYVLVEFQSRDDPWMPLRVMVYEGLFYQHLIREKVVTPQTGLPPVFPIVMYNGGKLWTTPQSLHELIALPEGSPLWRWQPNAVYHLIDEVHYPREMLTTFQSLVTLLIELEQCTSVDEIMAVVRKLEKLLGHLENREVARGFAILVKYLKPMKEHRAQGKDIELSFEGERPMLVENMQKWYQEAEKEGKKEGIKEGQIQALRETVAIQAAHRFGRRTADKAAHHLARLSDYQTLQRAAASIVDAESGKAFLAWLEAATEDAASGDD